MHPSLCVSQLIPILEVISLGTPFCRNFNKKNKHLLFAGDLVHIFNALPFFLMCIFWKFCIFVSFVNAVYYSSLFYLKEVQCNLPLELTKISDSRFDSCMEKSNFIP